jgi:murein L,D-transpeptidase YcbB/YkuD
MRALIKTSLALLMVSVWLEIALSPLANAAGPGTSGAKPAQSSASSACAAAASPDLCGLVESGRLASLRWPDFADYRAQLRNFYQPADYQLAWIQDGQPTAQARGVIQALKDADKTGLRAADYDGSRWDERLAQLGPSSTPSDLASFDLALTVSAMRYLADVHSGRISPKYFKFGLDVRHKRYDLADFLRARVVSANDVAPVLAEVEPQFPGYQRTKAALEHYLELEEAGDSEPLPRVKKPVVPGDPYPELAQLDQRLRQLGDLSQDTSANLQSGTYEGALVEAVKHFQQRHLLLSDGSLGANTIQQLNVPIHRRVTQLRLALERWRWLPHELPQRFLAVNIPGFELYGVENHHVSLSMPVVVGRAFRGDRKSALPEEVHETPVFMDTMEYIIFRPYWNIPVSIARQEVLPALKKDPGYLVKHQYEVYDNLNKTVIISDQLDDAILDKLQSGDLEFRQKPGPGNALGLIKFLFPNNYDVYMHGTPETQLFTRSRRDYSHGCIRVQDPVALAQWVLSEDPEWTREHILAATKDQYPEKKKQKKKKALPGEPDEPLQVKLPTPIPVLILYATAYVEENGDIGFFDDIYGYDKDLERALASLRPYLH